MKDGILNINKPSGMTSHDVIRDLRRLLNIKKIGHTGTLDPMATGVLPVCIGKATRTVEYMDLDFKKYRCTLLLGICTDTQDIWGKILEHNSTVGITVEMVRKVFSEFHGLITQTPPMYSAVRVDGRRLYEYAREGKAVDVKSRQVYIRDITIEHFDFPYDLDSKKVRFTVECSKGTYIRTICQDIGQKLGCGAVMESLCRIESGRFKIEDALDLDDLINTYSKKIIEDDKHYRIEPAAEDAVKKIEKLLKPVDYPLNHFGIVAVDSYMAKKFIDGWHISLKECKVLSKPEFADKEPEIEIRPEYRKAYKIYMEETSAGEDMTFLGVAFFNEKYHKLVADKVFFRSEEE